MRQKKQYINDLCIAIPFDDFNQRMAIVRDLNAKKARGLGIRGIEVDDNAMCVIYRERNNFYRY